MRNQFLAAAIITSIGLASAAAQGADMASKMAIKAPPSRGCAQAVDGVNGKLGGFGGEFANKSYYGGEGAIAVPLGCEWAAQLDLSGGSFDGRFIGTAAGHLFWRDPARGLIGAYGDFTDWDRFGGVHAGHVGPEGELYYGQWTVQGVAGAEFGNSRSGIVGSVSETFDVRTRFFDEVNFAFYPTDNLELYAGHRYLAGRNAAALGGEWGVPMGNGVMAALFAEARFGTHSDHGAWGGLRFYFGQKDKTLIRRHREDDPTNWNNGADSTFAGGGSQSAITSAGCPPPKVLIGGVCTGI